MFESELPLVQNPLVICCSLPERWQRVSALSSLMGTPWSRVEVPLGWPVLRLKSKPAQTTGSLGELVLTSQTGKPREMGFPF